MAPPGKRGPTALVTDVRDRTAQARSSPSSSAALSSPPQRRPGPPHNTMRFISVDNVLQYASDIPSARPRRDVPSPVPRRAVPASASTGHLSSSLPSASSPPAAGESSAFGSQSHRPLQPRRSSFGGVGLPNAPSRSGQPMPSRTTKISEKLVLLPETTATGDDDDGEDGDDDGVLGGGLEPSSPDHAQAARRRRMSAEMEMGDETGPLRDEELDVLRKRGGIRGKSYAERLPKPRRAEEKVSRVTAYCTAEAFRVKNVAEFLRKRHEAKTKLYDDCLYSIYSLPLLPGTDGIRLRSRPIMRTPGSSGKTVLDLEIERSERRDHHEGYFDEYGAGRDRGRGEEGDDGGDGLIGVVDVKDLPGLDGVVGEREEYRGPVGFSNPASPINRLVPEAKDFAEMFVYSYGVVVFWNFTEHQEKDILADLTFAGSNLLSSTPPIPTPAAPTTPTAPTAPTNTAHSLMTRPLSQEDFETEEFHFEYSPDAARPRVFNDMITLLPRSDHMVKLTISHAIAQSTKLCFFEERMAETMLSAQHVPKTMALTGQLNMERKEVLKMMGRLFKNRVEINLSSNILDVPSFFWDSEPTLHPLYVAIRDYLEIDLRIKVLNERCRVFLDLSEILSDSIADSKMNLITWIIIVLIIVSIVIEVAEVVLRTAIIRKGNSGPVPVVVPTVPATNATAVPRIMAVQDPEGGSRGRYRQQQQQQQQAGDELLARALGLPENVSLEDLRRWNRMLASEERPYVCGEDVVGRDIRRGVQGSEDSGSGPSAE